MTDIPFYSQASMHLLYQRVASLEASLKSIQKAELDKKEVQPHILFFSAADTPSKTVEIPANVTALLVTAGGGGGAGGCGSVDNENATGGSGGGAAAGVISYPIKVTKNDRKIEFTIGKGGTEPSQDGKDTVIKYGSQIITLGGGKGPKETDNEAGGMGGLCDLHAIYSGHSGSAGGEELCERKAKSVPPVTGGDGGNSLFSKGGTGGFKAHIQSQDGKMIPSLKGLDAESFSAGGGGSSPGIDKKLVGKGGDGFVCIQFV